MADEPLVSGVRCVACGAGLLLPPGQLPICTYHIASLTGWAKENAIWCHHFHRGMPLPRLSEEERNAK